MLHGHKLKGGFTLARLKGKGKGNEWLLIKRKDEEARHVRETEGCLTPGKSERLKE